jgi:hypothetical protein
MQRIKCAVNWSGIFPFLSFGLNVRRAVAAVKGTVQICAQQDDLFRQKTGLEFHEETNELLHLEYSFLWG